MKHEFKPFAAATSYYVIESGRQRALITSRIHINEFDVSSRHSDAQKRWSSILKQKRAHLTAIAVCPVSAPCSKQHSSVLGCRQATRGQ
jgi:hypothetical protein